MQSVFYVDPVRGQDGGGGRSPQQPLKTLTAALRLSQGNSLIRLKAGVYSAQTGEKFPLILSNTCQIVGEMQGDRPGTRLEGGGTVKHPALGQQSATCVIQGDVALQNVVITNTQPGGVGVWIEAGRATLESVIVERCDRHGGVVLGKAIAILKACIFQECGATGLTFFTQSRGQLDRVICRKNVTGMRIQDAAAPLLRACRLEQNDIGLDLVDMATPSLRQTQIVNNKTLGITLSGKAGVDLGEPGDPGLNQVRHNGRGDIQNSTGKSLLVCGNDLIPQRLMGDVQLLADTIPDPVAVPPLLLDQPADFRDVPAPTMEAIANPEPAPAPTVPIAPGPQSRFKDMAQHWALPFVEGLVQAGTVAGFQDGTFQPDKGLTRAEFAAFLQANFPNQAEKNAAIAFSDVPNTFWGYAALTWAQRTGFLSGFPDRTMRPNDPITRIQAIVALTKGLGLAGGRVDEIGIYRDRAQVPSYAVDALATATQRRLVVNHPDPLLLRPLETMTRGEAAALIYQGRVAIGTSAALVTESIVQPDTTQPLFSDLTGHWAAEFIRTLATANLISGLQDGRFTPDAPMLRVQFAALVTKAFQPTPKRPAIAFKDVPANHWGANAIQAAYRGEFLSGFPDQTFAPDNPMVRVQIWVALVHGLAWQNSAVNLNPLGQFADYTTLPQYALQATAIALEKHLIANHPQRDHLRPNQVATRADVCVAVYQALVALGRMPAIAHPSLL